MSNLGIVVSIFVAWSLAIGMALPVVFSKLKAKRQAKERTKQKLDSILGTVSEFDSRLQIVRSHALDYLNSLGAEGARQMSEIQNSIARIQLAAEQAKNLLESENFKKMKLAEKILDGKEAILLDNSGSGKAGGWEYRIQDNWNEDIEQKLQDLGSNVANASKSAKNTGIPTFGRQFKRETIHDLKEAGIDISILRDKLPQ